MCVHISYWMQKTIGGKYSTLVQPILFLLFIFCSKICIDSVSFSIFPGNGRVSLLLHQQQDMFTSIHSITSFLKRSKHFSIYYFKKYLLVSFRFHLISFYIFCLLLQNVWVFSNHVLLWLHGVVQFSIRNYVW